MNLADTPKTTDPIDPQVLDAAIHWMVLLRSGDATARDRARFDAWKRADPAHAHAVERLDASLGAMAPPATHGLEPRALGDALLAAPARRRAVRGVLSFGALVVGAGALADRFYPLGELSADLHTNTGDQRTTTLADGSSLTLAARSAADVDYRANERGVTLRAGALLVRTAASDRPFVVRHAAVAVHARAGAFAVRAAGPWLHVAALDTPVGIAVPGGATLSLRPGHTARAGTGRIEPLAASAADEAAWRNGQLVVHTEPLGAVIARLRPYYPGVIRVTDAAAALPVTGVFLLDDPPRTLAALVATLPLQVRRYAGCVVMVSLAPQA
ncbi:FecR family protein [Burkholderia sp. BCC1977]|uniref:FecR family protein n=1 Tax=Burkholderia sp. BCC1977 TaxID=2817440 RepID=UPI002ABE0A96|nr:FecR domain-containing protein [Burkholderia sp. BCC1977]